MILKKLDAQELIARNMDTQEWSRGVIITALEEKEKAEEAVERLLIEVDILKELLKEALRNG
jgi:DNA-binding MarR family transcriptional regulator